MKDTNKSVDAATLETSNAQEAKAKAEGDNTEAKLALDAANQELKAPQRVRLRSEELRRPAVLA